MKNLLLLLILFCFLATQKVFSQQPGTLDLTFGDNGISQTGMDDNDQTIRMQIDDLDRIYLSHYRNFSVTRFNANGGVDLSYGDMGTATSQPDIFTSADETTFLLKQEDGKMILGGYAGSPGQLIVARLDTSGKPDSTFGTNGIFVNPSSMLIEENSWHNGVLDPAGNIYIVGFKEGQVLIEKLTQNGTIDNSYNDDGLVKKDADFAGKVCALQTDGKLLVAGGGYITITRFKTNGGFDQTFGSSGKVVFDLGTAADIQNVTEIFPQPDGKILVVANVSFPDFTYSVNIIRLNSDGTPDNTFGSSGITEYHFFRGSKQGEDRFRALQQSDGKILVSYGKYTNDEGGNYFSNWRAVVTRFNTDGFLDNSFGVDGSFQYETVPSNSVKFNCTGIQSSGKIIAGYSNDDDFLTQSDNFVTLRLHNDLVVATCPLPVAVNISNITTTQATVSWTGNDDAYSYRIRKRPVGTTTWINSSVLAPITTKTLSNNLPSTQYEVQVQTYCDTAKTDSSGYTSSVLFTSSGECLGTTSESTTGITSTSATLNWSSPNTPAKWTIKYKVFGSPFTTVKISGGLSSYNLSGLTASTNYDWKIMAKCGSENSAWSPTQHFTTSPARLAEEIKVNTFSIYPNPAKEVVSIQVSGISLQLVSIKVYDVSGKEMATWFNGQLDEGDHKLSVDVSSFVKGIYFIRMITQDGIKNEKLIIQ